MPDDKPKIFNTQTNVGKCSFCSVQKERNFPAAARPKNSENSDKNRAQNLIP